MLPPKREPEGLRHLARTVRRSDGTGHMAENGTFKFSDPDSYAGAFGGPRINLTVTGAGDFRARLSRLNLKHLEICRFRESVPRIAYISLPTERIFVSFSLGKAPPLFNGFTIQDGNIILHGRGA